MADQTTSSSGGRADVAADIAAAGGRLEEERKALSRTMGETMGEAKDAVAAQARDLKDHAADRLGAEAESMKEEATAGLTAFSDALKAASAELSGKKLGLAGDMVQQAADGLEGFVRALEGRSPGEMLEGVRSFGRQNPTGFIAGSVLAGFALGRLAAVLPARAGSSAGSPAGSSTAGSTAGSTGMGRPSERGPSERGLSERSMSPAGGAGHAPSAPTGGAER